MNEIIIKSKIRDFKVKFVDEINIGNLQKIPNSVFIIGKDFYSIYKNILFKKIPKEQLIIIKLNEERKTLKTVIEIYKLLLDKIAKKNLTIISFGGGVNQDVVGFTASTLYRGVDWIFVPTTLLAMADSGIGLKTSLNFESFKNVVGTFYPPLEVLIDVRFLDTLKKIDYYSGVGEIIKLQLMQENSISKIKEIKEKVKILTRSKNKNEVKDIIKECVKIKLDHMEGDEFDKGKRNLLNYGHELGHALESTSSFIVPHGTAVLMGMIFSNLVSLNRGIFDKKTFDDINEIIIPNILKDVVKLDKDFFDPNNILKNMQKDKKRISENLPLVIPGKDLSFNLVQNLTFGECKKNIKELKEFLFN